MACYPIIKALLFLIVYGITRYMNCPICTGGRNIPIDQLKEHLIRGQHQMDKDIASYIVYLLEKIEKLEKKPNDE